MALRSNPRVSDTKTTHKNYPVATKLPALLSKRGTFHEFHLVDSKKTWYSNKKHLGPDAALMSQSARTLTKLSAVSHNIGAQSNISTVALRAPNFRRTPTTQKIMKAWGLYAQQNVQVRAESNRAIVSPNSSRGTEMLWAGGTQWTDCSGNNAQPLIVSVNQ